MRYLSSEVAGGFTGVYVGPYATGNGHPATPRPTSTGSTTSRGDEGPEVGCMNTLHGISLTAA